MKNIVTTIIVSAICLMASSAMALEKTPIQSPRHEDDWSSRSVCTLNYYNACTGWSWAWSGWNSGDMAGVAFDVEEGANRVNNLTVYIAIEPWLNQSIGTMSLFCVDDNDCPTGEPLWSAPWFPVPGANVFTPSINLSGCKTILAVYTANENAESIGIISDLPGEGPDGQQACGNCYPSNRETHSFYWGLVLDPLCPGSPFFDGTCNAELNWQLRYTCGSTNLWTNSWGKIKALYH